MVAIQPPMRAIKVTQNSDTNETAGAEANNLPPLMYNFSAFEAKTDEHGHFAITFVPPGENNVTRRVPAGNRAYTYRTLGTVKVKAGDITVFDIASEGRTVTGKLSFSGTNSVDLDNSQVSLNTPMRKLMAQMQSAKTLQDRETLLASPEFQAAATNHVQLSGTVNPDGTFRVDDVPPGEYEYNLQPEMGGRRRPGQIPANFVMFASSRNITVSAASDSSDNTPFDAGTLEMQPFPIPTFNPAPAKQ